MHIDWETQLDIASSPSLCGSAVFGKLYANPSSISWEMQFGRNMLQYSHVYYKILYWANEYQREMEFTFDRLRHAQTIGWWLLLCSMSL